MMIQKQHLISSSLLLLLLLHCTTILAQAPAQAPALPAQAPALPAQAPAPPTRVPGSPAQVPAPPAQSPTPPGPINVTKILEKSGGFTVLIRLLKATAVDSQLFNQLNTTTNGITLFAPTDSAFSKLKVGTLNALKDEQKIQLVQFHVVPQFISFTNFQTLSNPVKTSAGDSADGLFPLNVTNNGVSVNITSGLTNTSVAGTIYSDGQLAIYQVDKVLKPQGVFDPRPPSPAPAPAPPKKRHAAAPVAGNVPVDTSSAVSFAMRNVVPIGVAIVAGLCL